MNLDHYVWKCSCCGEERHGLPPAMAFAVPDHWLNIDDETKNNSKIDTDFCLIKDPDGITYRYIRCVIQMPLLTNTDDVAQFGFGVWMSVSERSWKIYEKGFKSGKYSEEGCFAYLSNDIAAYPGSFNLPSDIYFGTGNQRPKVVLHDRNHPLVNDQMKGMQVEILEAIASKWKH
jgi:hypothetical protein